MKKRCFYCDRPTFAPPHHPLARRPAGFRVDQMRTRDHIIPASQGGASNRGNIVEACQRCNVARGDHPAMFFLEFAFEVIRSLNVNMNTMAAHRQFCVWMLEKRVYPEDRPIPRAVKLICEEAFA